MLFLIKAVLNIFFVIYIYHLPMSGRILQKLHLNNHLHTNHYNMNNVAPIRECHKAN